jgi:hypothetical protein
VRHLAVEVLLELLTDHGAGTLMLRRRAAGGDATWLQRAAAS